MLIYQKQARILCPTAWQTSFKSREGTSCRGKFEGLIWCTTFCNTANVIGSNCSKTAAHGRDKDEASADWTEEGLKAETKTFQEMHETVDKTNFTKIDTLSRFHSCGTLTRSPAAFLKRCGVCLFSTFSRHNCTHMQNTDGITLPGLGRRFCVFSP